jgi:L-rhamnose isomerase/sugar isomerase
MAERTLKDAFETDARPLVAEARRRNDAALDPVAMFRASGFRAAKAHERVGGAARSSLGVRDDA